MRINRVLFGVACFALLLAIFGIVKSREASAVSLPWLCAPASYDPSAQPFVLGWCEWKPAPSDGSEPPGVSTCAGTTPQWAIDFYSSTNFGGHCARVSILAGQTFAGYDQSYTTLNGWHTVRFLRGVPSYTLVQSFIVGAHAEVIFCDTEPGAGFSCPTGIAIGNSAGGPVSVANWGVEGRAGFQMAAFELLHF